MFNREQTNCVVPVPKVCVPSKAVYRKQVYDILDYDDRLIIKGYKIRIKEGRIKCLTLKSECLHPNCNPYNNEFCLPHTVIGGQLGDQMLFRINQLLSTYYLDDCYEFPRELFIMRQNTIGDYEE